MLYNFRERVFHCNRCGDTLNPDEEDLCDACWARTVDEAELRAAAGLDGAS
jgi:NMD protein affecting ribosome stability and mRNA decay